jgi:hypothetical protein
MRAAEPVGVTEPGLVPRDQWPARLAEATVRHRRGMNITLGFAARDDAFVNVPSVAPWFAA